MIVKNSIMNWYLTIHETKHMKTVYIFQFSFRVKYIGNLIWFSSVDKMQLNDSFDDATNKLIVA